MEKKYTPERITELKANEVFVFGSNLAGAHAGGAARIAMERFGAVWGQGIGLQGQSYAIPTMQGGVETIKPYVDEFIEFARQHRDLTFLVTRIGCGIAGYKDHEIAPLFARAYNLHHVILPIEFVDELRVAIRFPESWNCEFVFDSEDVEMMNSLPAVSDRLDFKRGLIKKDKFQLTDAWAVMPSGSFLKRGDKLVGFKPADDNIVRSWKKPFQNRDGMMVLKHLIFPGEGITDIADGLFENTEVVGKVDFPWELEGVGDYVFAKSKIGILTIYHDALKCKYGRQFKDTLIDKLCLPETTLPLAYDELGLLHSIAANAKVNKVCFSNSEYMDWNEFKRNV